MNNIGAKLYTQQQIDQKLLKILHEERSTNEWLKIIAIILATLTVVMWLRLPHI